MATSVPSSTYDRTKEVQQFDESKIGVKGLSDSAITCIPKIFIHPPETLSTLQSSQEDSGISIPLIDLANINSKVDRPNIIHQVKEAAKSWGFFQVINHGIDLSILENTIQAVKAFHEQPAETKAKFYKREERGLVMFASNNDLYRSKAASWHDYLQVWMSPARAKEEMIPEICRREAIAWDFHAPKVAETVMELLCEGLGLEAGKFKELTFSDERLFVGVYYPSCPQPDLTLGLTPHTDPGALTVLLQNQIPGLQVKHGDQWVNVKPLHGALTINIGDFLQIISNGEYNSVQHRVLANTSEEARISVVMFFNVSKWKGSGYYGPLPELISPEKEKPALYREFTKEEFFENFYSKGLDSKSLIDKLKL